MTNPLDGRIATKGKWSRDDALVRVADWNAARAKVGAPGRLKVVGGLTDWRVIEVPAANVDNAFRSETYSEEGR